MSKFRLALIILGAKLSITRSVRPITRSWFRAWKLAQVLIEEYT